MAEQQSRHAFWTTLPGILTGIAAVVTAITGLIVGLLQYGGFRSGPGEGGGSAGGSAATEVSRPAPAVTERARPAPAATEGSRPAPPAAEERSGPPATADAQVTITARDGKVTTVYADSLQHRQTSRELYLLSGQRISFDRIRTIAITRQESDRARVRITLRNGAVHEDAINAGLFPYGFSGTNDLGAFEISVSDLDQITFAP
jgi:hypothetical protein